jgi:hypothetical protein
MTKRKIFKKQQFQHPIRKGGRKDSREKVMSATTALSPNESNSGRGGGRLPSLLTVVYLFCQPLPLKYQNSCGSAAC